MTNVRFKLNHWCGKPGCEGGPGDVIEVTTKTAAYLTARGGGAIVVDEVTPPAENKVQQQRDADAKAGATAEIGNTRAKADADNAAAIAADNKASADMRAAEAADVRAEAETRATAAVEARIAKEAEAAKQPASKK